jgi:hypothetical protein
LHANGAYPRYAVNSSPIASARYSVKTWPFCKRKRGDYVSFQVIEGMCVSKAKLLFSGWWNYRNFRKLLEENKMLCKKMTF